MDTTEKNWVNEVGEPAAAALNEMVAALECDYERLAELRELRPYWSDDTARSTGPDELAELEEAAGECESREEAEQRIMEDPLSLEVRGDWHVPGSDDGSAPTEFKILLSTGGPAVQIRGELGEHNEPARAWLEVQDWGKPWTQYHGISQETLLRNTTMTTQREINAKRIAQVLRMNPVNAGLAYAARELDAATVAHFDAQARYWRAVRAFNEVYERRVQS